MQVGVLGWRKEPRERVIAEIGRLAIAADDPRTEDMCVAIACIAEGFRDLDALNANVAGYGGSAAHAADAAAWRRGISRTATQPSLRLARR